jgi:hypothetical protein
MVGIRSAFVVLTETIISTDRLSDVRLPFCLCLSMMRTGIRSGIRSSLFKSVVAVHDFVGSSAGLRALETSAYLCL